MFEELKAKDDVANYQEQKKTKYLGSMTLQRGHTLFEYNVTTDTLVPAEYINGTATKYGKTSTHKTVVYKKGKWYIGALNEKNARKKVNKLLKK